jgi:murein hydrolase activator
MLTLASQSRRTMAKFLPTPTHTAASLAAIILMCGLATPAVGSVEDTLRAERMERERALDELQRNIEASREEEAALQNEIESLREDRVALNRQLISTADRIRNAEGKVELLEGRIAELVARETTVRNSLRGRSGLLAELLAALQRMGRRPPPAVLVSSEDALRMVRSAMLLGAVLPELRVETEMLASDLVELTSLKDEIDAEREQLLTEADTLDRDRRRIAALMQAKQRNLERSESELGGVRARATELAAEAQDMQEFIASLDREIAVTAREGLERARRRSAEEALEALRDPGRMEPAMPFEAARGLLPRPAAGPVIRDFGAPDELDSPAPGISIATRTNAQVTSPSDGWVVYAGPFRSYGQLLIVNAGDGYHILLAGMANITVELGQFVLTGEPVGSMNGVTLASTELASTEDVTVGARQPILYVEFRKDGRSIDPAPWWADGRTGVSG